MADKSKNIVARLQAIQQQNPEAVGKALYDAGQKIMAEARSPFASSPVPPEDIRRDEDDGPDEDGPEEYLGLGLPPSNPGNVPINYGTKYRRQ
jgi:hypothetical protein